jgi:hypothetical protein
MNARTALAGLELTDSVADVCAVLLVALFTWWFLFRRPVVRFHPAQPARAPCRQPAAEAEAARAPRRQPAAEAGVRSVVSVVGLGQREIAQAIRQMIDVADPNTRVAGLAKVPMSLLALACSFKMINKVLGTALSTRDVKALLARGADARAQSPEEGTTALFLAVSYADSGAIEELLAAGADVHAQDSIRSFTSGETALYNAALAGNHKSVLMLLDAGADAATRLGELCERARDGQPKLLAVANAAEKMLAYGNSSMPPPPSWKFIGAPSISKWVKTFELLVSRGASIGPNAMKCVGNIAHAKRNPDMFAEHHPGALQSALVGVVLGTNYQGRCCSGTRPTWDKAGAPPRRSQGAIPEPGEELVAMLSGQGLSEHRRSAGGAFAKQMLAYMCARVDRGATHMSESQLRSECCALGLRDIGGERAQMEEAIRLYDAKQTKGAPFYVEVGNCSSVTNGKGCTVVCPDGGARGCFVKASADPTVTPTDPVTVFAFLSCTSPYTVMSPELADRLGVLRSDLKTKSGFVTACAERMACDLAREVTITVGGGVSVTLKTAVVVHNFVRGLQLGLDFFMQAERCALNVLSGSLFFNLLPAIGSDHFTTKSGNSGEPETMRFHALGGCIATVPLLACDDGIGLCAVAVDGKVKMQMCDWCGRPFPGLKRCPPCADAGITVCYCSGACQKAAWPEHKQTVPHHKCK